MGQESIIKRVEALTNSLNIPHLLFAGPAGTGKSTIALIVVKELFGETWKENYLELNASDERGINVVREKVKNFAHQANSCFDKNTDSFDKEWREFDMIMTKNNISRKECLLLPIKTTLDALNKKTL